MALNLLQDLLTRPIEVLASSLESLIEMLAPIKVYELLIWA